MAVPGKADPSQLELLPARGTDPAARLGTATAWVRGISSIRRVIKREGGALGRLCGERSLCSGGAWLGAALRRKVSDGWGSK